MAQLTLKNENGNLHHVVFFSARPIALTRGHPVIQRWPIVESGADLRPESKTLC